MMTDNKNEEFPIVDEMGNILGAITRGHAHDGSKILHPVVHLHVFNSKEVREELGITDFEPESLGHYVFESQREKELVYVHRCVYDGEVKPSQEELAGGRFWSKEEIKENIGKGVFTPNFENEYQKFFDR